MARTVRCLSLLAIALLVVTGPAGSVSLPTQVLRGAAIGFAVKTAAKPLNQLINTITLRHKVGTAQATKVVPILSIGEKGYIGGAQVAGPKDQVDRVKAVFQYEKNFDDNNYRAKVLLASASLNPLQLKRVPEVGVSAIIDVSLDGKLRVHSEGTGIQTGDVIRGAAVLAAVKVAGPSINKAVNTLTLNKGAGTVFVPMGSIGEKAYLGGAQVSAAEVLAGKVKAVWQYEDLFSDGRFRVKVLVPVSALNPLQMKRVDGAGITAVVDMALSSQESDSPEGSRPSRARQDGDDDNDSASEDRHDRGRHLGWERGRRRGHRK